MSLIQALPSGALDIVGDIHGEIDALEQLLPHLGYDAQGQHPGGRTLVFVGDFCDRGPDSPAVLMRVAQLVASGRAVAVIGNHEINLLRNDAKDGAGWYFDARLASDEGKYAPFARPTAGERAAIVAFLSTLPVALERPDLRIVHAAWLPGQIAAARQLPPGSVRSEYDHWEAEVRRQAQDGTLARRMAAERQQWPHDLEDPLHKPPFLQAHADNELLKAMLNPLKVLTSGVERQGTDPFVAGGKWRFVERMAWWDSYTDATPVVVGHYWRRPVVAAPDTLGSLTPEEAGLFGHIPPFAWHGQRHNVFCVDYSVGGRWRARQAGMPHDPQYRLAALRWPERTLLFEDGTEVATTGFGA
ncbi:metallophosphoesterase [Acidovorax sp. JHL-9]|uniref:metallophosphoesterase n=1 Tax=Acidovorax sp. JHL-9 TaxID=1276756 RepID=UPI00040EDC01|nr:metallophosphoesterase [Acidovorax sp. JHL-9]